MFGLRKTVTALALATLIAAPISSVSAESVVDEVAARNVFVAENAVTLEEAYNLGLGKRNTPAYAELVIHFYQRMRGNEELNSAVLAARGRHMAGVERLRQAGVALRKFVQDSQWLYLSDYAVSKWSPAVRVDSDGDLVINVNYSNEEIIAALTGEDDAAE